ncbi:MAG: hypothetical protein M3Y37_02880 [Chloroflexota bacterium]|nr:hypothetical protein [Chloroflexota bacterium]
MARAILLIVVGFAVTIGSAASDTYLHRGTSEETDEVYRQPLARGLATNVDLRGMSDNELFSAVNFLRTGGYRYARQEFSWATMQPAVDEFVWTEYRRIVDALHAADIQIVAVLVDTPAWARAPEDLSHADAPPLDPRFLQNFCVAFRAEFQDLQIFQIGDQLDNPQHWGGSSLQNVTYRNMVRAVAQGLDVTATDSVLISGEVGRDRTLREAGADIAKLEQLVQDPSLRGLLSAFAIAVDGGSDSPYDREASVDQTNLSRVVLVREAIDNAGATNVPLWFTHFGWSGDGDNPVGPDDQARFVESGIRRARAEWPWVGVIFNWTYAALPESPETATMALIANGQPTPLMTAMGEFSRSSLGSSMTNGFAPATTSACAYSGNWQDQHLFNGIYKIVRDPSATVTCRFWGTGISVYFRFSPDAGNALFVVDSDSLPESDSSGMVQLRFRASDASELAVPLVDGLQEGLHTVTIGVEEGSGELVIGGYLVERERPMIWPIAVLVAAGLVALFLGFRSLGTMAAEHAGIVDPPSDTAPATPLPTMPNWQPGPRFNRAR